MHGGAEASTSLPPARRRPTTWVGSSPRGKPPRADDSAVRARPGFTKMTSFVINNIIEKTENRDKDFRYMATSDMLN